MLMVCAFIAPDVLLPWASAPANAFPQYVANGRVKAFHVGGVQRVGRAQGVQACVPEDVLDVHVANTRDERLVQQVLLDGAAPASQHVGQTVTLRGWLYNKTGKGKLAFLQVRDGTGICQCVVFRPNVGDETFAIADKLS